jgi:hypothetical protein
MSASSTWKWHFTELRASAAILGADKAVHLGYADSGHGPVLFEDPPGRTRFARADIGEAAGKLAALLTEWFAEPGGRTGELVACGAGERKPDKL